MVVDCSCFDMHAITGRKGWNLEEVKKMGGGYHTMKPKSSAKMFFNIIPNQTGVRLSILYGIDSHVYIITKSSNKNSTS